MGDEERFQQYSGFEYETRKKKNKKKRKPNNLVLNTNLEDTQSEDSNLDATALGNENEDEQANEQLSMDGLRITGESSFVPIIEGSYIPSSPPPPIKPQPNSNYIEDQEPVVLSGIPFNENALSRFAATYELEKFKKNALLIFNQEDIDDEPRHGTQTDVEALTNTFEKFNFEVKENIHHDLTKDEIFRKVKEFTTRDYTDYGCIGIAVLTHGSRYGRLRAQDKSFSEIEIINYLKVHNKPTLVTKPKFLIIQACRGTKIKPGVAVLHSGTIRTDTDTDLEPYHLPEEADMLILHSCYVGSPALRHEVNGSWFIQSLCSTIDKLAKTHDLESIITEVKRIVAIDRFHTERDTLPVQMCQMPVLTSTLIRKLYLKKFGDPPPLDTGLVLPMAGVELMLPTRKDSQALDVTSTTPLLPQFGPCSCFLDHFNYMRDCLKHFVEDNPNDTTGQLHLDLAIEFEDKVEFNTHKQKMLRIIHDHLKTKAKDFDYYKYLFLCNK